MIDDPEDLASALAGGPLDGRPVRTMAVPKSDDRVMLVKVTGREVRDAWRHARSLLDQTGRWPVTVTGWKSSKESIADPLVRTASMSPAQRRAAAEQIDLAQAIAAMTEDEPLDADTIQAHLEATRRRLGDAPEAGEVAGALGDGADERALDRWLMEWEEERSPTTTAIDAGHLAWYGPAAAVQDTFIAFLPTAVGHETFTYFAFWAEESVPGCTPERLIAVLASWEDRFGAELVNHWGTMLELVASSPPTTLDEAWELAWEQVTVAPGTTLLPGVPVRDHARTLLGRAEWHLHERP